MIFVFWQNVISIHQSAFIKAISKKHDVVLVVSKEIDDTRKKDGWIVPDMGNAKIIISPDDSEISRLILMLDAKHVFSGIDAFPLVFRAFKLAVKNKCSVSVMAEPYQSQGVKGFLRRLKYAALYLRYGRSVDHFFATGDIGIECYRKVGFPIRKLHQWGYFTENSELLKAVCNDKPNVIFIGKIDTRKNILPLVSCMKECRNLFGQFLIIGTGPLESELKNLINGESQFHYLGALPNREVALFLRKSDLLILPSLFDGWGAVVNEALGQGVRVLCSDRCGAGVLLDGRQRGGVFNLNIPGSMLGALKYWLSKGALTVDERSNIAKWASENISGETAAQYFVDIFRELTKTEASWLK